MVRVEERQAVAHRRAHAAVGEPDRERRRVLRIQNGIRCEFGRVVQRVQVVIHDCFATDPEYPPVDHERRNASELRERSIRHFPGLAHWRRSSRSARDSVKVGNASVDTYEASVRQVPDATSKNRSLVKKIPRGKVTLAMLQAAGAVQLGCAFAPFDPAGYPPEFPASGNWTPLPGSSPPTPGIYALSIPGVVPTTCTTQLQSGQGVRAGRQAPRDRRRVAARRGGHPDPGALGDDATTCVTNGSGPATTSSRSACVSSWAARDMVGNV